MRHHGLHIALLPANHHVELGPAIRALKSAFGPALRVMRFGGDSELETPGQHTPGQATIAAAGPLLSLGAGGFYYSHPQLSILLTRGEPELRWSAAARALRPRLRLIVPELSPALAEALLTHWGEAKKV